MSVTSLPGAHPEPAKPHIAVADEAVASLRTAISGLLDLIDSGCLPDPHGVIPDGERAGPVWKPGGKWRIRALNDPGSRGFVYVTTPDAWDGDYEAFPVTDARRLAMTILAACDWAERGGPEEPGRKFRALDDEDRVTGRSFICGRWNPAGGHL